MRIEYRETKMRDRLEQGGLCGRQSRKIAGKTVQEDRREDSADRCREDSADRCGEDVQNGAGKIVREMRRHSDRAVHFQMHRSPAL